jgi:hypothetical protein
VLVVELILRGAYHGIVARMRKMCIVSAFCVHTVSFSKNFMYFMRIHNSDYGVWNPYLSSVQRLHLNVLGRQCSVNYSTSVEAPYHDVRHAELLD